MQNTLVHTNYTTEEIFTLHKVSSTQSIVIKQTLKLFRGILTLSKEQTVNTLTLD